MKQIYILALAIFAMGASYAQPSNGNFFVQNQNKSSTYPVGNFLVEITAKKGKQPQITVANKAEPNRLLWQTVSNVALVSAATGKGTIIMFGKPQGQFKVTDTIVEAFNQQTINSVDIQSKHLVIKGTLSGKTGSVAYSLSFIQVSDNQLQFVLHADGPSATTINRLFLRYASPKDEHVYGFGEQLTYFDQKGNVIPILVQEHGIGRGLPIFTQLVNRFADGGGGNPYITCAPAPQYITSKLNSLFLENKQYSVFNLKTRDRIEAEVFSDTLTGRIVYGKTPLDLINEYTAYSGRMRKLPDWINNGAIVCVQNGKDTVNKRLAQLDSAGVPLAALWIQDWSGGHNTNVGHQLWWNWHLDKTYYPDWDSLVNQLHKRDVQMLTYINPFLAIDSGHNDLFLYARQHDFLVKHGDTPYLIQNSNFSSALVDLSNPAACNWIKEVIKKNLIDTAHASGWMADFAEAMPFDATLHNNADPYYWHNHYTEKWAEINREAIHETGKDAGNFVFFNRSGFTQSPFYSTLFWLGDQMQTWDKYDGIKTALTGMLSGGISGFSLMHSDIGGYNAFTDTLFGFGITIARSKELLMRWEELNIFNAIYRTHEGINPKISAQYYTDNETMAHFARSTKIFKALSFYRKQLMQQAADSGYPIVRHPFLKFPDDPNTYELTYQFMYGSEFMVAPVLDGGRSSVKLYLPKGSWVNLWTGETLVNTTGKWITANAPIGKPVMFYQTGSEVAKRFIDSLASAGIYVDNQTNFISADQKNSLTEKSSDEGLQAFVYPNPVQDVYTVKLKNTHDEEVHLVLTDVNGRMKAMNVTYSSKVNMKMNGFPAGLYLLRVSTQQQSITLKVIKK